MKQRLKRFFLLTAAALAALLPLTAFAQAAPDYVIKSEEIVIRVNEDNTYDISKKITADFSQSVGETHGITETVPVDMKLRRMTDGQYEESGAQWAGRILGLKRFIETAEADRIKMMVRDDPALSLIHI